MIPLTEPGTLGDSLGPGKIFSFWKGEILSCFSRLHLVRQGMWAECHRQETNLWGGIVVQKPQRAQHWALRISHSHSPIICVEETFLSALMSSTWNTKIVTRGECNGITGEKYRCGMRPCVFQKAKLLSKTTRICSKGTASPPLYSVLIFQPDGYHVELNRQAEKKKTYHTITPL